MRKTVIGTLALLAVLVIARPASADYVCTWWLNGGSSSAGSAGSLAVTTYTSPLCAGTFTGTWFFCSAGATSTSCASAAISIYSDSDLNALHSAVTQAGLWNLKVNMSPSGCIGGGSNCASKITFYPYGY